MSSAQFRNNVSVATLQQLYCLKLLQHTAAALRSNFQFDEVRQRLQTRNDSEELSKGVCV